MAAFDIAPIKPMVDVFENVVREANKVGSEVKDLTSGRNERVASLLNESDDPKVAEWRAFNAKLSAQIEAAIAKRDSQKSEVEAYANGLLFGEGGEVDVEGRKKVFAEKRKSATEMRKALITLLTGMGAEDPDKVLATELDARGITEIVGLRGATKGGTTGIKRPRLASATVNGEDVPAGTTGFPTFGTIASYVSTNYGATNANDLKAAAFKAAGTEDLGEVSGPLSYVFTLPAVLEGKSKDVTIVIESRQPEADNSPAEVESEDESEDASEEE